MKQYQVEIKDKFSIKTKYIESADIQPDFYTQLANKHKLIALFDPVDKQVVNRIQKQIKQSNLATKTKVFSRFLEQKPQDIHQTEGERTLVVVTQSNKTQKQSEEGEQLIILETPNYWITRTEMSQFSRNKRYSFQSLYQYQKDKFVELLKSRNDFKIANSKSQDKYNRNKIPKEMVPRKTISRITHTNIEEEAIKHINKQYPDNYGIVKQILYPTTRKQSTKWLKAFFEEKLVYFGVYEDAIDLQNPFLYHSVISPMLNVGLLTDSIVIQELIKFCYKLKDKGKLIPIESLEAFIRQVIGWRNYVFMVYCLEPESLYKENQLNHKNKIGKAFWFGQTGIQVIDKHIEILNETAYLSHIPRLMVLGNFMLLLQIDPVQVLNWFTVMFIDSSDTLMIPNIVMSQYNSKIMMTRPYISSFNYIKSMSNQAYSKEDEDKWNTLFYNFLLLHSKLGLQSYVYASITKKLRDSPLSTKQKIKQDSALIIKQLTQ